MRVDEKILNEIALKLYETARRENLVHNMSIYFTKRNPAFSTHFQPDDMESLLNLTIGYICDLIRRKGEYDPDKVEGLLFDNYMKQGLNVVQGLKTAKREGLAEGKLLSIDKFKTSGLESILEFNFRIEDSTLDSSILNQIDDLIEFILGIKHKKKDEFIKILEELKTGHWDWHKMGYSNPDKLYLKVQLKRLNERRLKKIQKKAS